MKKILFFLLSITSFLLLKSISPNFITVKADALSDNILEQLQNIDVSKLESFFNELTLKPDNIDFFECFYNILNGQYDIGFDSVLEYVVQIFFNNVFKCLPTFISIIAISIFCGIIQSFKSTILGEGVCDIIFLACFLSIVILVLAEFSSILLEAKNTIKNIAKLCEIMSPIILTLMLASGGNVSATIYKPAVVFLSNGIINIVLLIIFPLISITMIFSVVSNFSSSIKIQKFSECSFSIMKWILGIVVAIFSVFLSIQGITSACYDGISIKATKYALSNSIPIIGGFVKDSFDLVVAGSILIKNTVGITSIFALFFTILSPILFIIVFCILLKLIAALIESISDVRISNFCYSVSKCISYISTAICMVGLMLFVVVFLMIVSANSFV